MAAATKNSSLFDSRKVNRVGFADWYMLCNQPVAASWASPVLHEYRFNRVHDGRPLRRRSVSFMGVRS